MVIPFFRGSKGVDPKIFVRECKKACIGTWLKIIIKWFNFFPKFLEGTISHWFEQ
jgi:hypothetical protein